MLRRSPRALLLWLAALAVAAVTAVVVAGDLATLHRRAQRLGPEVSVAVAGRDLATGTTLAGDDLTSRRVHKSQMPPGALTATDAQDRVVAVPLVEGAYVSERNLAPRERDGLDGVVPPGMRIVHVAVDGTAPLRAGVAVDVLAAFQSSVPFEEGADPDTTAMPATLVARGALVIATDDEVAVDTSGAGGYGVTLLVTDDEAGALAFASAYGVLTIAVVPPEEARGTFAP